MKQENTHSFHYDPNISPKEIFTQAPTKVSQPLLAMCNNSEKLSVALANIWQNQPETHSHFLGGALFVASLSYSHSALEDCVRMRYEHNLPIKLTWSIKRWRDEHELGARRATAQRLSEESSTYSRSIVKAEAALNEESHQYLVRNSHELGQHGIEMRHCIASYHSQLKHGNCAVLRIPLKTGLVTAFVNLFDRGETVEASLSSCKKLLNEPLSAAETKLVRDLLGATQTVHSANDSVFEVPDYLKRRSFFDYLDEQISLQKDEFKNNSVSSIRWTFYGYGDSGSLEDVSIFLSNNRVLDISELSLNVDLFRDGSDLCDYVDFDWYNNDGGQVEVELDRESMIMTFGGYTNYTESEQQPEQHLDLIDEEDA